ncbi:hypothetical protein LguiA_006286 [Lonicera macranthoides]
MAMQTETPPGPPSAQVVGNAFVEQYYHILHHSPDLVYKFYHDSSVLSRPDASGVMTSVTTMKGINDKICSLDYNNYKAEIKTADAQESYQDGVIVLVTGCLTGTDNLRRKFTQSFFLAPQDKGFFVLNDVFRYIEESEPLETKTTDYGVDDNSSVSLTAVPEPSHIPDSPMLDQETSHVEETQMVEEKSHCNENQLANEKVGVDLEAHSNENHSSAPTESASSIAQENAPKKSYASIVSSQTMTGNPGPSKVYVPANTSRITPTKTEKKQPDSSVAQVPAPDASVPSGPSTITVPESRNALDEGEGHSIYIRNLPLNLTVPQLEAEFKKFGPIRQGGVQVRSNKGFCFGFVEFQDLSSMQNAVQASPVTIGNRQAAVEIKRTTTRVGSGRGRFSSGRGGFRSESFRGRGNFSPGRGGYGRNDFGGRGGEFSVRGRGPPGGRGGGDVYHQQGRGRGGRRGGPAQSAIMM